MRACVLGPVQVAGDCVPPRVLAPKERTLLAVLVAESNRVVSVDRLIDELWGESAPRTARRTLHTYVWHLRRMLPERLASEPGG